MLKFILQRLILAIPTLLIVIGIVFVLYQYLPGDPVEASYTLPLEKNTKEDSIAYQIQYDIYRKELGLDKPIFFFNLSLKNGFQWNGFDNQYIAKVLKIIKGDFGISYRTKKSALSELSMAIRWTLSINLIALILIFSIGIALGLMAAWKYNQKWDKNLMQISFILDAIPSFWLATMGVVFFTTNYYGMKIFPSTGLGNPPIDVGFSTVFLYALPHLILPILCILLSNISIVIRQMRASAIAVLQEDYIRTGIAKGLNNKQLTKNHVLPNALFPIITLIGMSFPSLIAGTIFIENIFNIPGMGKLSIEAILNKDFPILFTVILLIAFFTIIGNIVSDVLYRMFNPKL